MKAGGVIATIIASYLAGKVLYGTGKAISRALGGYPSKEVEKKIDALQPKLNVMFEFYESKIILLKYQILRILIKDSLMLLLKRIIQKQRLKWKSFGIFIKKSRKIKKERINFLS